MELLIRKIEPRDLPSVMSMLREFAEFENLAEYCTATEDGFREAMFGDGAVVEGLIAVDGEAPAGYAIFYPSFSSFRAQRGLYLEDIFIRAEYRGTGVGLSVLKEIARQGRLRGFERIDFLVLDRNSKAIRFYEKFGADRDPDERHFKFTDKAFERLALSEPPAPAGG